MGGPWVPRPRIKRKYVRVEKKNRAHLSFFSWKLGAHGFGFPSQFVNDDDEWGNKKALLYPQNFFIHLFHV